MKPLCESKSVWEYATYYPYLGDGIRVQCNQVPGEWLLLRFGGTLFFCKPYKMRVCKRHQEKFCYDCGSRAALNEVVCTILSEYAGLPRLKCAWISYEGRIYFGTEYLERHAKLRDYLRGEGNFEQLEFVNGVKLAAQTACFDLFVNNRDRTCANYLYRRLPRDKSAKLFSIDYDKALLGEQVFADALQDLARGKIIAQKCQKLLQAFTIDDSSVRAQIEHTSKLLQNLPESAIQKAVREVPSSWWHGGRRQPEKLIEALCMRRGSFKGPFNPILDPNPCIRDRGNATCANYKFPEMFQGQQYLTS